VSEEEIAAVLDDTGRLARIEAKLERIDAKLTKFDQLIMGFVGGPGIAGMFKAIKASREL
jgi:hypothetical protein